MIQMVDNFSDIARSKLIYIQEKVPVFQNKVYKSVEEAKGADFGRVELMQSSESGFIFNGAFDPTIMNYDENYQNEQSNSGVFKSHLDEVLNLLLSLGISNKKIVEIGCGKAVFFELLLDKGLDCTGFDPTYEGNNLLIIKEYFSEKYVGIGADVVIMRHTLEHIPSPFSFLHTIANANQYKGMLFVEVPTFDWIYRKDAFWDIFFEHCNYFTEQSLDCMFDDAVTGSFFGGQYIYLWADLSKLRPTIPQQNFTRLPYLNFEASLGKFKDLLEKEETFAIWGAGAKGSTFLNLLDPDASRISYVIDINPIKQNKFIACTGHSIYSPSILDTEPIDNLIIMNENYIEEIKQIIGTRNINLYHL